LLSALKDKTNAHAQYFNFLAQEADKIQQITLVGDEQSQKLMTAAANMGISLDQVADATKGAIGLSEKFKDVGLSQETAMKGIALAYEGDFNQLQRYIPELKSASTASEKMAILQREMASGFNMASDAITTNTGKIIQLQNKYGDLKEKVGGFFMEAAIGWGQALGVLDDADQKYAQMRTRMAGLQGDIVKMRALYDVYRMQKQTEETKLAMQVLREMAEEWERAQEASQKAQEAETERLEQEQEELDKLLSKLEQITGKEYVVKLRTEKDEPDYLPEQDVDPFFAWHGFSQEDLEARESQMNQTLGAQALSLNSSLLNMAKARTDQEMNLELNKLHNTTIFKKASAEEQAAMEKKIRDKYAKEKRKIAIAERANALAQVTFNTVIAYMKALAAFPLSFGKPWTDIIAAMGVTQAGVILGTPLPKYGKGGIADKPSIFGEAGPEAAVPLPDGKSIPVTMKSGGGESKQLDLILKAIQAVNANIAALNLSVTIETTDPETRIRNDNEIINIMRGAGDDGQPL